MTRSIKTAGVLLVWGASLAYAAYRIANIAADFSYANLFVGVCEVTLLAYVCIESILISSRGSGVARKQDASVLIESAQQVLRTTASSHVAHASGNTTKVDVEKITATGKYESAPVDVIVFAENASLAELRRCFLSLSIARDLDHVYVIDPTMNSERGDLISEFNFHALQSCSHLSAATNEVLVCRGTDILYPDACEIARTYDISENNFLELRSVYSDERALGTNGVIEVSDKRQVIREALATRGLSTWSTGPAMVASKVLAHAGSAETAAAFFHACERNGIHGYVTDEVMSEEISREQTTSEVKWRAVDYAYTSRSWSHSYKAKGTRLIGWTIKAWSALANIAVVRRCATIGLVLAFTLAPARFAFVNQQYALWAAGTLAVVGIGAYMSGDRRTPFARIREFYFDFEAIAYNMYKKVVNAEREAQGKSIVKKLPVVSALLVITDAVLVYRVASQYNRETPTGLTRIVQYGSLFAGYALLVTLLIGLGMVVVRQSRAAMRREISRGANLNDDPVSMVDLSPGGAGCVSVAPYEIGATVAFTSSLPMVEGNVKFSTQATVRSCVAWDGSYRVGLEFVDIDQEQNDVLETYCSIVFPHEQARQESTSNASVKVAKLNGVVEKRFLSYAASFIALAAIIFSNLSSWK